MATRREAEQNSARRTRKAYASETESNENEFERPNSAEKPTKAIFDSKDMRNPLAGEQKKDG